MTLTNCHKCQYFNHHPHHYGDIVCSQDPAYAEMWKKLKSLDEYTIGCLPVDDCTEFKPDPSFLKKEITLTLTLEQWQQTAFESSNPAITHAIRNVEISSRISLTQKQWQQIAESTTIDSLRYQLELEGIEPDPEIKQWIRVDSSCIEAIAFDNSTKCLKIRFNSDSVYQYNNFDSSTFSDFCNADSKGHFFNHNIKDCYSYQLVS
jgi:KTSC domain